MHSLNDAVERYHELLTSEVAEQADHDLRRLLRERNLYFGDRPLCVVLRPHFYLEQHWRFLKGGMDTLLTAFQTMHEACLADEGLRAQLKMDAFEEALIPYEDPRIAPWTSSRLDTFYLADEGILKCVEYNAETPAGMGYADLLYEVFEQLEPMKRFGEHYHMRYIPLLGNLADALLSAYHAWGGREQPQVAVVDWHEVPTLTEHHIIADFLERKGLKTILADPRHLEYRDGHLWSGGFRIDLVYKRVLFSELHDRMGLENPLFRAFKERAIFITNSISAKMLAKKASLAFLSDERNSGLFSVAQRQAVSDHIPWTRLIEERHTLYNGHEVDLVPFVAANKERFVLKPNDEYGGSGVMLGWECSDEVWEDVLQMALERPYVVQERVHIVERPFPAWMAGQLDISPRFVDADPYVFMGRSVEGGMTRLSSASLLNVTAGGGSIVPTLIIEPKT